MAAGLTPLSELEAVNEILAAASESPISTLEDNQVIDASLALNTLRSTSVEIQTRGWFFNTEELVEITPDTAKNIILPPNALKVVMAGESASLSCVQRGTRLYNKTDRTLEFESAVFVDLTLGLDFDELPSSARQYITIRAARKYVDRYSGEQASHVYTQGDENTAAMALLDEHIEQTKPNMLNDSTFMTDIVSRT